ncbi:MAG TPA: autotransporter domain-containing protein [Afipia sp.]
MAQRVILGNAAGQSGNIEVTGGSLTITPGGYPTGSILVGNFGTGTVTVSNGGKVSASSTYIAANVAGATGTVTVTGTGSQWSTGLMDIGSSGNGTLNVRNGATVDATSGINAGINIGNDNGAVGVANVESGSHVTTTSTNIGSVAGSTGTLNVTGNGTIWTSGGVTVGGGTAGALNITAGGKVESFGGVSIGDQVVVSGPNSQLVISGNASTGIYPSIALGLGTLTATGPSSLLIENGGKVTIQNTATATTGSEADFRIGRTTAAATVTVTGAGSALTTPYDMLVGYATGSNGIVNVSNGGTLNTGHASIAEEINSTGSVTVTGANSIWTISDSQKNNSGQGLFLGLSGGAATLTIANGGVVNVNSTGQAVSTGSNSIINIGAAATDPAAAAGALNANSVALGGTSQLNFNHTSSNYIFAASIIDNSPAPTAATVNFLAGTTILTGHNSNPNSFSGKINISSGATAQFGNGGTDGLVKSDVKNDGAMVVKLSSLFESYGGVISGSGTFEQAGTGTLALTGNNTYSGLTKVSSGTLKIGNGGTSGSIAGNIENNSHLAFDRSNNFSFNGLISGTGDVAKRGSGTLTLGNANTYTGGTSVSQGTLSLGASNRLASIGSLFISSGATFNLANFSQTVGAFSGPGTAAIGTGSLTFGNNLDRTFQGFITGSGSFIKQGTGSFTMTADNSAYTGATTVNDGFLIVNNSLSNSATTVNSGSTLGGTGTVGATTVNGTIAPGPANAIGTLNVNGTYTQAAGSFYNVNVSAAGASDLVNVTGAANINGGTLRVSAAAGSYDPSSVYTILTSSGLRSGNYAGVTSNFAFLDPSLTYDANNVYLTLARNNIDFASIGITPNQISAGGGLAALGVSNPIVGAALMLTPEEARAAFDVLSGELHPSLHSLMIDESQPVRDAILGRQRQDNDQTGTSRAIAWISEDIDVTVTSSYARKARKAKGGPKWPIKVPPPAVAPVYGAWVQGYGNWTRLNSDGNAAALRSSNGGAIGGFDVTLNHNWRFGFAAGGGRTDARVDARLSSATIDTFHLAAYGGGSVGDILFRTGAAYSHHDVSTSRTVVFPGFADTATAKYDAHTSQIFGEAVYRLNPGLIRSEAFANIAHVRVHSDSFTESGGPAALGVAAADTSATFTTIGLRAQAPIPAFGSWAVTARGSLGWQHAFDAVSPVSWMAFAASTTPFAVAGVPIATDAALIEAGIDALVRSNTRLSLMYTARLAADASAHAVRANLTVRF